MPHLIPAAADPTASVGNVRSLTAVGDSDSFLSLSPILLISNHPLFPLTSLFPLQIFESYVGWWLLMMGNTDKFLLFSPAMSLCWAHLPVSAAWPVLSVMLHLRSWFLSSALLMQTHSPSSSLSVRCSLTTCSDGTAAIKPQGLSAQSGLLKLK